MKFLNVLKQLIEPKRTDWTNNHVDLSNKFSNQTSNKPVILYKS